MRESPFSNQLTQEIQRAHNMTNEEAEAAKVPATFRPTTTMTSLRPYVDTLAIEGPGPCSSS